MEPLFFVAFFFFFGASAPRCLFAAPLTDGPRDAKGESPRRAAENTYTRPHFRLKLSGSPAIPKRAAVAVQFWGRIFEVNGRKNKKKRATAAFAILKRQGKRLHFFFFFFFCRLCVPTKCMDTGPLAEG